MKNLDVNSMKGFIEFKKSNNETVFNLFVLNLFASAIVFVIGYDYLKSFLVLLPFIIISFLIFIIFKFIKKSKPDTRDLFCGMEGMVLTMICQTGLYLFVPKPFSNIVNLLILSVLLNLLIILFITWFSINWVRSKRSVSNTPVSVTIILSVVIIAILISRQIEENWILPICCIALSCVSSLLFVYIIKYIFANILKKQNTEGRFSCVNKSSRL
jgi:hypothetical protein